MARAVNPMRSRAARGQVRVAALPRRRPGPAQRGRDERDTRGRQRPAVRRGQHQRQVGVPGEEHPGDQSARGDDGRDAAAAPGRRRRAAAGAARAPARPARPAATAAPSAPGCWPAQLTAVTPSAAPAAATTRPRPVPAGGAGAAQPAHAGDHQGERDRDERDEPEEHPVPREPLGDQRRHRRPDQRRQHPGRRHEPEHRGPGPLRVDGRDRHEDRHELRPRARPLQHPPDQQLGQRARGAGDDQPGREQQRRDEQRGPGPREVAPAPAQHRPQHGRGEERARTASRRPTRPRGRRSPRAWRSRRPWPRRR